MYSFNYQKAKSVADASAALGRSADAKVLAGGQSLVAAMKLRLAHPTDIVDLGSIEDLRFVRMEGSQVSIGAMTTHATVAASSSLRETLPALAALAGGIGDRQVRNFGTIGGSIANNDPAADYPAGCVGLGATIATNKRKISADSFFKGIYETALEAGEIITAVNFPVPKRAAYMKFKNPASRFAIVGVFVADFGTSMRVAVTGAGPCVFRVPDMEKALASKFAPESVANIRVPADSLNSDIHAQADYRSHLVTVMAQRAVEAALK